MVDPDVLVLLKKNDMATDPFLGRTVGPYRIEAKLGEGGMGTVYLAVHETLQQKRAFKILPESLVRENAEFADRFLREARAAAGIDHVNVVKVYDAGKTTVGEGEAPVHFIVHEYVYGVSLARCLEDREVLPAVEAASLVLQAARGLAAAGERNIIHRDIKPANLMITDKGVVKVADFGLAKNVESDTVLTQSGQIMGTPAYMSPEQADGLPVDARSDIYALGVTFYELVTGVRPFNAPTPIALLRKHCDAPVPDPRQYRSTLDEAICSILNRMLAKDPADRFPNHRELLSALEAYLDDRKASGDVPGEGLQDSLIVYVEAALPETKPAGEPAGPATPRTPSGIPETARPAAGDSPVEAGRTPARVAVAVVLLAVAALAVFLLFSRPWGKTPGDGETGDAVSREASEAPGLRPPDPAAEAKAGVDEALEQGEIGLALARADKMLETFPERREAHDALETVVAAEVQALVEKERFDEALALIEKRRETQDYVSLDGLERDTLLRTGAHWADQGYFGKAAEAYGKAYRKFKDDATVLRAVIRDMNRTSHTSLRSLAEAAALDLAALTEGPLDDGSVQALLNGLYRNAPSSERAGTIRRLLADRAPNAAEAVRDRLHSDHRYTRWNAFRFLTEQERLSPAETLGFHVRNFFLLKATGGTDLDYLDESMNYVEDASLRDDWPERRKRLDFEGLSPPPAFKANTDAARRFRRLFAKAFLPEAEPSLLAWMQGRDLVVRHAAFHVLTDAGPTDRIDLWRYHAGNLDLPDYRYRYAVLGEAIAFFRAQAKTERAGEARAILQKARATMNEHLETQTVYQYTAPRKILEGSIREVAEALEAFE